MNRSQNSGFTLTELLVAILVTLLLGVLLLLACRPVLNHLSWGSGLGGPGRTKELSNGVTIYRSVFGAYTEEVAFPHLSGEPSFPHSGQSNGSRGWSTSSQYFTALCSNEMLSVDWSFFAGGKLRRQTGRYGDGTNGNALHPGHNAWVVVNDLDPEQTGALFLMTRDVPGTQLESNLEKTFNPQAILHRKTRRTVAIFVGGGAVEMTQIRHFTWGNLNPAGDTNSLLRP